MSKPENPPFFPTLFSSDSRDADWARSNGFGGATLRDWFAGQALTKAHDGGWSANPETVGSLASYCYAVADAMLAERAKEG